MVNISFQVEAVVFKLLCNKLESLSGITCYKTVRVSLYLP